MNQFFANLFKALGVLALSAFIFFLFEPKDKIKDQAVNLAMEFLGKRLMAMVPREHERDIEAKFEAVQEQALKGEINDQQLQDFTTIVLNAEAEGQPLALARIDSALVALHENEATLRADEKRRAQEEARLEKWAQRIHEFEQFEKRWQTLVADSNAAQQALAMRRLRPLYRLSKQFVVQIDSAALAHAIAAAPVIDSIDSLPPLPPGGHFPPPPHFRTIVRRLEGDLRGLRVELHPDAFAHQQHWVDSTRARARSMAREQSRIEVVVPETPIPPRSEAQPRRN